MKRISHPRGTLVLASTLLARTVMAGEPVGGGLVGWVENTQGAPVAGAVVSLFGKGIRGGSLVTLTDSAGQFALRSLPAGSYTLRAIGNGNQPASARQITVLPNRESLFTVNLTLEGDPASAESTAATSDDDTTTTSVAPAEWRWLVRHRRRSVLEAADHTGPIRPTDPSATAPTSERTLPDVMGDVEFVTAPVVLGSGMDTSALDTGANLSALHLRGRFGDTGSWNLGGLVAESANTTWRIAAEFVVQPLDGHVLETGVGFGTRALGFSPGELPAGGMDARSVGALFLRDKWTISDRLSSTFGARYTFVGFVADRSYVDPFLATALRLDGKTTLHGSVGTRTLVPGGDLLTLSTLDSSPALVFARLDPDIRVERARRAEVSADRVLDASTTVSAYAFDEGVRDPILAVYDVDPRAKLLRISNAGAVFVRGMGVTLTRRFGSSVRGSVTYTYGRTGQDGPSLAPGPDAAPWTFASSRDAVDFHDLVARIETIILATDTRLAAYCRFNSMPESSLGARSPMTARFDVQLTQGLPFLQALTRAEWEVLLSVRNLSYETSEAGTLDELAVLHPPKRILGGVSVRF